MLFNKSSKNEKTDLILERAQNLRNTFKAFQDAAKAWNNIGDPVYLISTSTSIWKSPLDLVLSDLKITTTRKL